MPVGSPAFIQDSRTNVANVAPQHQLHIAETYPTIQPSYWQSITAESGGTRLESIECARVVIGSVTGNHLMFIGGLEDSAPFSGRGLPLYPGLEGEREMFIENANRIRVCAAFSGELIYYMGYIAGNPTTISPATQGSQPNNEPPVLVQTDPLDGQNSVEFQGSGIQFTATFNENIASGTADVSSYSIRLSGNFTDNLSGTVSYFQPDDAENRTRLQFIPFSGQLQGSSWYKVYIGTRIADDFGSTIPSTLTWSFVTAGIDDSPFFMKSFSPVSGTSLAPFSQTIEASFSKAISGTINNTGYTNNIFLWNDNTPNLGVSGVTILDADSSGAKLKFTPIALLTPSVLYRYTISGVTDRFGQFASPVSGIAFSTGPADTAGPIISGVTPSGYPNLFSGLLVHPSVSGNVNTLVNVVVVFDERISGIPGGIISGQVISLVNSGATSTNLSGIITLDNSGRILTFDPVAELISGTTYQIRISGVRDVNGNIITQTSPPRSGISFTTWIDADVSPPVVQSITPASGTLGVAVNSNVVVTFNETLSGTHPDAAFTAIIGIDLSGTGSIAGTASTNSSGTIVTFNPTADLSGDRNYYVSISGAQDLALNRMSPISGHVFRTLDNIAPTISGTNPASGAVDVATNSDIIVTFSEPISGTAGGSVTADVIRLYKSGVPATPFAGSRTLDASTRTVLTFNPTVADLDQNEHYQIGVSGVRDVSGNQLVAIAANSGISFLTQGGPIITSTNPTSGAISIGLGSPIITIFNKAISGTANGTVAAPVTKLWLSSASPVALGGTNTLNSDATQLTFTPSIALLDSKIYVFAISGVKDLNNNFIVQTSPPRSGFAFSTLTVDTTPPTITSTVPTSGAVGVLTNTTFVVNFGEDVSGTIGQPVPSHTVRVALSGHNFSTSAVAGTVTKTAAAQLTFTPSADLSGTKAYTTFVTGVYDLSTNVINQITGPLRQSGAFSTVDNIAPLITLTNPSAGQTGFLVTDNLSVTLNETCSGTVTPGGAVTAAVIGLARSATPSTLLPGALTLGTNRTVFTFNPNANLVFGTEYIMSISGIQDLSNNAITSTTRLFTTQPQPLSLFYDNPGTNEKAWNSFDPDITRDGELRQHSASSLNGKVIKRASFKMRRIGTAAAGSTITCRIRTGIADNSSQGVAGVVINTMLFNDVPTTAGGTRMTFENLSNSYEMNVDDWIGIEWPDSTASVTLVTYHSSDQVDGTDTQTADYDTEWDWIASADIDAKLEG